MSFDQNWMDAHLASIQRWDEDGGSQPTFSIQDESLRTGSWRGHPTIITTLTANQQFCGYSHCRGECGFPALVLEDRSWVGGPRFLKMHGSMVACGPVWQTKRWDGEVVYMPQEYRDKKCYSMYWR